MLAALGVLLLSLFVPVPAIVPYELSSQALLLQQSPQSLSVASSYALALVLPVSVWRLHLALLSAPVLLDVDGVLLLLAVA